MANKTLSLSVACGSISQAYTRTGDDLIEVNVTLPAGVAGTLTTRTDNDTGILTVASGHGILDTDYVDVYWSTGKRTTMDVTAVTSTTISIDLGAGDNLPSSSTAVVVVKRVIINKAVDGDNVSAIALSYECSSTAGLGCAVRAFDAINAGGSEVGSTISLTANTPIVYDITGGATNPFTGNPILSFTASNSDTTADAVLKIVGVQDVTP